MVGEDHKTNDLTLNILLNVQSNSTSAIAITVPISEITHSN